MVKQQILLLSLCFTCLFVSAENINQELYQLYKDDQSERESGQYTFSDDSKRKAKVEAMLKNGLVKSAKDYFHAAIIFQHGTTPKDFKKANYLALKSVELDPGDMAAKWLSCASEDRYLRSIGEPQIWGTQFIKADSDSKWSLAPIDTTAVSDEERIKYGVPTLKELQEQLNLMNSKG